MTSNIISFAQVRNERRAAASIAEHERAAAERVERECQEIAQALDAARIADQLGGSVGAQIIADVVTELRQAEREASAPKFVPAYCDPTNEVRGSKYEATKHLYGAELTARIRQDIKDEQKAGRIDKAVKVSVRTVSYADGFSIEVRVLDVPADFRVTTDAYASWIKQFGDRRDPPIAFEDCKSPEYRGLIAKLQAIRGAYNRDNSDSSVDYFDTKFYGSAEMDWRLRDRLQRAEVAASAGDYWAESCGEAR